jgi:hypothetical protein
MAATLLQEIFKLGILIEVVFKSSFIASSDHEHVSKAGCHCFLDHILNGWFIHHWQHLFWGGFGGRKEARA